MKEHRRKILTDTGYCARHLLGWNYDKDDLGEKVNVGSGGVRADGAHLQMTRFVDDPTMQFGLLEAPRGSYKSTILQAFCIRQMLLNPNVRILYGMKTDTKAEEQASAIQRALMLPEVEELFGKQLERPGEAWRFTLATRTKTNIMEPTMRTMTLESMPTGGHYDFIILDDLIDAENVRTPEAMEKASSVRQLLFPLRDKGTKTIFVGTRYGDGDLYSEIEGIKQYKKLILKAGVRVVQGSKGELDLEIGPEGLTFPHLSMRHLKSALLDMQRKGNWYHFSCQYLNEVPVGVMTPFRREMFKVTSLSEDQLRPMSGYLLTDTATSMKEDGCYSVCAYVAVDEVENYYLLDLRVGHWRPAEFVNAYFSVLQNWQKRVNHIGEVWESISLTSVFKTLLEVDARHSRTKSRILEVPRSGSDVLQKTARILRLETMLRTGHFFVVAENIPVRFTDLESEKELFNPEGYVDKKTGVPLPSGELVDEFLRLNAKGQKKDIADALALMMEHDRHTDRRICVFRKPPASLYANQMDLTDRGLTGHNQERPGSAESWWDRTLKGFKY